MSANVSFFSLRLPRWRHIALFTPLFIIVATIWHYQEAIALGIPLITLPFNWLRDSESFIISKEHDNFDVTFADYAVDQMTAGEGYEDKVPAILHHIMLGNDKPREGWNDARQTCIDLHPGWETMKWTNEMAAKLVEEKFPDFKPTWDGYKLPIQRVDTLRYLILYEYGGAILDMDIQCKRSLGPLRRFDFVAPAAHPTGFSVSFLMSSKHNEFIGSLITKWLKLYDRDWFNLPYATVMYSTGGHFASTIHVRAPNRGDLKILAGPPDNFKLHTINGPVSTPLFNHLGSSSWHSYDGLIIMSLGKNLKFIIPGIILSVIALRFCVVIITRRNTPATPRTTTGDESSWLSDAGQVVASMAKYIKKVVGGFFGSVVDSLAYMGLVSKRRSRSLSFLNREDRETLEKRLE